MGEHKRLTELGIQVKKPKILTGPNQPLRYVLEKEILIHGFQIKPSKYPEKNERCMKVGYSHDNKKYVAFTIANHLMEYLEAVEAKGIEFPVYATITNKNDFYEFI